MHPFASYVLRSYYQATGWNDDNLYLNLTRSSTAILDFTLPKGLMFNISKAPNALFKTTYSMNALPSLNGSVGYIFTSCDLDVKGSNSVRFKDMIERFKVYDAPRIPESKEQIWQGGERIDTRDYLLYGRIYVPTARLDALYSTRLSRTLQLSVAGISYPTPPPRVSLAMSQSQAQMQKEAEAAQAAGSNLMFSLQHDTGRWCTEYSYSVDDGMLGARVLHNFGKLALDGAESSLKERVKRIDEEEAMEGGLKGRFSAGAEVYFSAKEKSGGISTGLRFTTLPDATPPSFHVPSSSDIVSSASSSFSQPPTTLTATLNPMMGHISTAYAARVSRDLALCSRFDFNVYSYESEWTMGTEWWIRRAGKGKEKELPLTSHVNGIESHLKIAPMVEKLKLNPVDDIQGVLKARVSTNADVSIMWETRLRNALFSLGVVSDLSNRSKPIRSVGLEIAYFSSE
ncbi:Mitochondrial distribution and morphology protein 10 [Tulasnella sp. JGI-2019a]|nr:Mitochondrial distribution and morphology protein 10 [Tulasnella sp. JGI-2019a]KAG9040096.1 Mitochondrial distribution and morphology protein 10 [Tulasnella sp. JGI-2019a]